MEYLFGHSTEIKKRLGKRPGFILMLDFDGTLSPIAPAPAKAVLPKNLKYELQKCSRAFPTAIISGRPLKDIKNKVRIKNIIYAGNHGLEWQLGGNISRAPGAGRAAGGLAGIAEELKKLQRAYPGCLLENKGLSLAAHYRLLDPARAAGFKKAVAAAIEPFAKKSGLRVLNGRKVIELRPDTGWNKGSFALFLQKYFQNKFGRRPLPVYMGDDATDEDAFLALKRGITVRVGQSRASRAKYYIKNQGQAAEFLAWLRG